MWRGPGSRCSSQPTMRSLRMASACRSAAEPPESLGCRGPGGPVERLGRGEHRAVPDDVAVLDVGGHDAGTVPGGDGQEDRPVARRLPHDRRRVVPQGGRCPPPRRSAPPPVPAGVPAAWRAEHGRPPPLRPQEPDRPGVVAVGGPDDLAPIVEVLDVLVRTVGHGNGHIAHAGALVPQRTPAASSGSRRSTGSPPRCRRRRRRPPRSTRRRRRGRPAGTSSRRRG